MSGGQMSSRFPTRDPLSLGKEENSIYLRLVNKFIPRTEMGGTNHQTEGA
jgi:hypothetical protein